VVFGSWGGGGAARQSAPKGQRSGRSGDGAAAAAMLRSRGLGRNWGRRVPWALGPGSGELYDSRGECMETELAVGPEAKSTAGREGPGELRDGKKKKKSFLQCVGCSVRGDLRDRAGEGGARPLL